MMHRCAAGRRAEEREPVLELKDVQKVSSGPAARPHGDRRASVAPGGVTAGLILATALVLGACAIPFGNGTESTDRSPAETRRERNRLYLEEQQRMQQQQLFDRGGPSDR
jgi:hypothetical protein